MKITANLFLTTKRFLQKIAKQLFAGEQAEITVEFKGKKIVQKYRIIKNGL